MKIEKILKLYLSDVLSFARKIITVKVYLLSEPGEVLLIHDAI